MAGLHPWVFVGLIVAVTVAVAVWDGRRSRGAGPRRDSEALALAVRSARRRTAAAVGVTFVLLVAGIVTASAFPDLLGMPLAIAPAVAGAGGLLLYAATPPAREAIEDGEARVASLEPRRAWSFASRGSLAGLTALAAMTIGTLLATGMTSSPDESGRYRTIAFATETAGTSASPYPGWFYASPLIAATLAFVVTAMLALRRVAVTPSLVGAGLGRHDRVWRVASTRVLIALIAATLCLQLGGVSMFTGIATSDAASADLPGHPFATTRTVALWIYTFGQLVTVAGVIWFTLAIVRAFRLPRDVTTRVGADLDAGSANVR